MEEEQIKMGKLTLMPEESTFYEVTIHKEGFKPSKMGGVFRIEIETYEIEEEKQDVD